MKISHATKVGIMTIVALAMLILGFNYLKRHGCFQYLKKDLPLVFHQKLGSAR